MPIIVTRSSQCSLTSDEEVIADYKTNSDAWHICPCGTILEKRDSENRKDVARISFKGFDKMKEHSEFRNALS